MANNPEPAVRVVFRKWPQRTGGEVLALLPDVPDGPGYVTCYAHIGQHSSANYAHCMRATRPATPDEYAPLLRELTSIGYNLIVCKRR